MPLAYREEGVDDRIAEQLNIWSRAPRLERWEKVVSTVRAPKHHVRIAVVGKYVELKESYKSLNEALAHGGIANDAKVELDFVDAGTLEEVGVEALLKDAAGILVPGGFGLRGTEGKMAAIRYAREKGVPFFGICLGMQMAAVEFARNVLGLAGAGSTELDASTPHPVIHLMAGQQGVVDKGGTMRLGAYPCSVKPGTLGAKLYGKLSVSERHRHRYEFNNDYRARFEEAGFVVSGVHEPLDLVEMLELKDHPFFLGVQSHPEFQSKPFAPHPLFAGFIHAALEHAHPRSS